MNDNNFIVNFYFENVVEEDYTKIVSKIIREAVDLLKIDEKFEVDITFCDNDYIKEINNQHRNIDKHTDVLSFPILNILNGIIQKNIGDIDLNENKLLLGDVIISIETAKKQATEYGHSIEREIAFLTAHGMLHLLGFDHEKKEDELIMFEKQELILNNCGYKRGENNGF